VPVDVVDAGLCVVFGDEDRGVLPVGRVGDCVDDPPEGEIVVGDLGGRARERWRDARGVVGRQGHGDQRREVAVSHVVAELSQEDLRAVLVRDRELVVRELAAEQTVEGRHVAAGLEGPERRVEVGVAVLGERRCVLVPAPPLRERGRAGEPVRVLAIGAHRAAVAQGVLPQEAGLRVGERVAAVEGIRADEVAERLLEVIRRDTPA
jgi:hypothetical protein